MDITQIIQHAKDTILAHGEHTPALYVLRTDARGDSDHIPLAHFSDSDSLERRKYLFTVGMGYGQAHPHSEVCQVVFICEMWLSSNPGVMPSADPQRTEILSVQVLDADKSRRSLKQSLYAIEMLRSGDGTLVDLLPHSQPIEDGRNYLPEAFLAGFLAGQMPEGELAKLVERYQ